MPAAAGEHGGGFLPPAERQWRRHREVAPVPVKSRYREVALFIGAASGRRDRRAHRCGAGRVVRRGPLDCPPGAGPLGQVLADPRQNLGAVRIYRWHGAGAVDMPTVVRGEVLVRELELTYGEGDDHAEGMGLIGAPEDRLVLIVYDSPAVARLSDEDIVIADIVRLP